MVLFQSETITAKTDMFPFKLHFQTASKSPCEFLVGQTENPSGHILVFPTTNYYYVSLHTWRRFT